MQEQPGFAVQASNKAGVLPWVWGSLPTHEVVLGAKAVFSLKTESAETHRVLSLFLVFPGNRRIGFNFSVGFCWQSSSAYFGELKLSERYKESGEHMRSASGNVGFLSN